MAKTAKTAKTSTESDNPAPKDAETAESPELPGQGTEFGGLLQQAHDAFTRGNYHEVRKFCGQLENAPEEVAAASKELLRRTRPDPAQLWILAGCVLLFLFITWKYVP